jgi:hypothetical protein
MYCIFSRLFSDITMRNAFPPECADTPAGVLLCSATDARAFRLPCATEYRMGGRSSKGGVDADGKTAGAAESKPIVPRRVLWERTAAELLPSVPRELVSLVSEYLSREEIEWSQWVGGPATGHVAVSDGGRRVRAQGGGPDVGEYLHVYGTRTLAECSLQWTVSIVAKGFCRIGLARVSASAFDPVVTSATAAALAARRDPTGIVAPSSKGRAPDYALFFRSVFLYRFFCEEREYKANSTAAAPEVFLSTACLIGANPMAHAAPSPVDPLLEAPYQCARWEEAHFNVVGSALTFRIDPTARSVFVLINGRSLMDRPVWTDVDRLNEFRPYVGLSVVDSELLVETIATADD